MKCTTKLCVISVNNTHAYAKDAMQPVHGQGLCKPSSEASIQSGLGNVFIVKWFHFSCFHFSFGFCPKVNGGLLVLKFPNLLYWFNSAWAPWPDSMLYILVCTWLSRQTETSSHIDEGTILSGGASVASALFLHFVDTDTTSEQIPLYHCIFRAF